MKMNKDLWVVALTVYLVAYMLGLYTGLSKKRPPCEVTPVGAPVEHCITCHIERGVIK